MQKTRLGKTDLMVTRTAFGALPIQRDDVKTAVDIVSRAFDAGINFFDTARAYTDSEHKLGLAFGGNWDGLYLATKTAAETGEALRKDLETSLRELRRDYVDIYQLHNPAFCPKPGDQSGLYDAMLEAKAAGKIRHIGITNHRLHVAQEAIDSGLYETLQFPFSYLATEKEQDIVQRCEKAGMGFIAMKSLCGGLIHNSAAAYAWMAQFENVLPIWGIQRREELESFLSYAKNSPALIPELEAEIKKDRTELRGDFCRGCGYCMPCPAGIVINNCARMSLFPAKQNANFLADVIRPRRTYFSAAIGKIKVS